MPTVAASGSTASTASAITLYTAAAAGNYVLKFDSGPMVNGDTLELQVNDKVLPGGSLSCVYFASFSDVQQEKIKISVPIPVTAAGATFTMKRTGGADHTYDWAVVVL